MEASNWTAGAHQGRVPSCLDRSRHRAAWSRRTNRWPDAAFLGHLRALREPNRPRLGFKGVMHDHNELDQRKQGVKATPDYVEEKLRAAVSQPAAELDPNLVARLRAIVCDLRLGRVPGIWRPWERLMRRGSCRPHDGSAEVAHPPCRRLIRSKGILSPGCPQHPFSSGKPGAVVANRERPSDAHAGALDPPVAKRTLCYRRATVARVQPRA